MPKAVNCYICGRKYGTQSIGIHVPQCKKKWEAEESLKPKRERRPLPPEPESFGMIKDGVGQLSMDQLDKVNEASYNNWNDKALVPCPGCARTFLPDAL